MSGGLCAPLPERDDEDEEFGWKKTAVRFPSAPRPKKPRKNLSARIGNLEAALLALTEFGDDPGHPFRGNQYTAGEGSGDTDISKETRKMLGIKKDKDPVPGMSKKDERKIAKLFAKEGAFDFAAKGGPSLAWPSTPTVKKDGLPSTGHVTLQVPKGGKPKFHGNQHVNAKKGWDGKKSQNSKGGEMVKDAEAMAKKRYTLAARIGQLELAITALASVELG